MATASASRAHGAPAYRRLASSLGLPPGVLSILAIDPFATVESAARIVSESIGARAYRRLDPAASVPARGSAVLAGLRAMRAADREPIEPELRRAESSEPAPPCSRCDHAANMHADGGPCASPGCRCAEYQESDEPAEPADPRQHAKPSHKPHADPKREDMIGRLATSTGASRERVAASMAALGFTGATRPTGAPRPAPAAARATAPVRATITAADRQLAALHGYDPADVARSRAALGFGVTN